ncbi:hypothetical protein [Rhizobium sp. 007]|uniref:hypothetical protein n=1 Tax=Rhizobium sp. 007 TaxID=2785056 RepID=UPI00188E5246|nr:hypothetical protein [Rhizobium sp. 007]QPB24749.1 hypothetical protein ISN39_35395 [Rhizobium sp. 007]
MNDPAWPFAPRGVAAERIPGRNPAGMMAGKCGGHGSASFRVDHGFGCFLEVDANPARLDDTPLPGSQESNVQLAISMDAH